MYTTSNQPNLIPHTRAHASQHASGFEMECIHISSIGYDLRLAIDIKNTLVHMKTWEFPLYCLHYSSLDKFVKHSHAFSPLIPIPHSSSCVCSLLPFSSLSCAPDSLQTTHMRASSARLLPPVTSDFFFLPIARVREANWISLSTQFVEVL